MRSLSFSRLPFRPVDGQFYFRRPLNILLNKVPLHRLKVGINGTGEMATGLAWRRYQSNLRNLFMMEIETSLAVRREVRFCEVIYNQEKVVEMKLGRWQQDCMEYS